MEDEKIIDLKAIIEARKEKGEVEQNTHEIIAQAALYSFYSIIREYDDILYCMYKTGTSPADLFEVAKKRHGNRAGLYFYSTVRNEKTR